MEYGAFSNFLIIISSQLITPRCKRNVTEQLIEQNPAEAMRNPNEIIFVNIKNNKQHSNAQVICAVAGGHTRRGFSFVKRHKSNKWQISTSNENYIIQHNIT